MFWIFFYYISYHGNWLVMRLFDYVSIPAMATALQIFLLTFHDDHLTAFGRIFGFQQKTALMGESCAGCIKLPI
jgi:hypothetical protein